MSTLFNYSSNTVTVGNPKYNEVIAEPPRQQFGASGGGTHKVYQRGDSGKTIPVSFVRLTQTVKDNFLTWIQDQANYMENAFDYTDPHAVIHTNMRFTPASDWKRMFFRDQKTNLWNINLVMERDESL